MKHFWNCWENFLEEFFGGMFLEDFLGEICLEDFVGEDFFGRNFLGGLFDYEKD